MRSTWTLIDQPAPYRHTNRKAIAPKDDFTADVIGGLMKRPKRLASKYLYDAPGSALFDRICQLPEYYLTRTELAIMRANVIEIVQEIGPDSLIVELGSGSSMKTRLLLDHLDRPRAYMPIDISREHVLETAAQLRTEYPAIDIEPIVDDFCNSSFDSARFSGERVCVYFPGSTIGNFERAEALRLLRKIGDWCGDQGGLLIGFDLQKDVSVLEAAYNDADGVTAAFSLNLLQRMNREASANFHLQNFRHVAFYHSPAERIEIYIESHREQHVQIGDSTISFAAGERIHTEYSHKYTVAGFAAMAEKAGLAMKRVWTDDREYFAVMYLENKRAD